jgi:hypothetical protein
MQVPTLPTMKPFPLVSAEQNAPFAPGKAVAVQRILLAAGGKFQLSQVSFACQKVTLVNEGGGDLAYGLNGGVNLSAPAVGAPAGNAFEIASGAGKDVWVEDAQLVWIGSVAGTTISVEITGISGPPTRLLR